MNKEFYVDIDALRDYSRFLKNSVLGIQKNVSFIVKENLKYQMQLRDNTSKEVDVHINQLKKIFDDFSNEIDAISKNVNKEYELYLAYTKKIKL